MGTLIALEARAPDTATAERAVDAGYAAVQCVDRLLHPTRRGSELALLNGSPPGTRRHLDPWTAFLLRLCRELCLQSDGIFEPALPGQGSIRDWEPLGSRGVWLRRRARIDLGGIAKGYAIDQAIAAMRRAGAHAGLANAGGDLRVYGATCWQVMWRNPRGNPHELSLRNLALAASGDSGEAQPNEHRGYYRRGERARPAPPRATAVIAPSAALADALTKVQMFAAPARAAALLARYRARALRP
ncbi:MAG: FAD:protein FMN transferase [Gammaproteobacteria bacterium]|nr:FAD:protein FMN transferase [Gammaproteobacteria bacterium]MDE2251769.1 FAD:protein FMN transferase [Gammaproteobacteria bacterium]